VDDPDKWLPIVNAVAIVTLLLGLIAVAQWLRSWIRKIVHEEVSQPLSKLENTVNEDRRDLKDVKRDVGDLNNRFKRHQKRTHERIDQLRRGQTHG
jgi:hypothetical protein